MLQKGEELRKKVAVVESNSEEEQEESDVEVELEVVVAKLPTSSKSNPWNRATTKSAVTKPSKDRPDIFKKKSVEIDPNAFMAIDNDISGTLDLVADDDGIDVVRSDRVAISQAFASDDVLAEFGEEKCSIIERDKPKDIDLTLPGWGDWGGPDVKVSSSKRKRYVTVKLIPRRHFNLFPTADIFWWATVRA